MTQRRSNESLHTLTGYIRVSGLGCVSGQVSGVYLVVSALSGESTLESRCLIVNPPYRTDVEIKFETRLFRFYFFSSPRMGIQITYNSGSATTMPMHMPHEDCEGFVYQMLVVDASRSGELQWISSVVQKDRNTNH